MSGQFLKNLFSSFLYSSLRSYLIGVPKRIFENQHEPPQLETFQQLENDKNARIIRHLCIIRTAIERNFKYINDKMRVEYKTILSLLRRTDSAVFSLALRCGQPLKWSIIQKNVRVVSQEPVQQFFIFFAPLSALFQNRANTLSDFLFLR